MAIPLAYLLLLISPFSNTTTLLIDGAQHTAYLADNVVKWTIGYMNVSSYDPRGVGAVGMLFKFPRSSTFCFWMKNTKIPLKIVWINGEAVTSWHLARPLDETPVCGYGDKVLELRPDLATPSRVSEQRPLH
ncbi:MAG: DUF192 domain-containing protein [Pyrobaculum sp.]